MSFIRILSINQDDHRSVLLFNAGERAIFLQMEIVRFSSAFHLRTVLLIKLIDTMFAREFISIVNLRVFFLFKFKKKPFQTRFTVSSLLFEFSRIVLIEETNVDSLLALRVNRLILIRFFFKQQN